MNVTEILLSVVFPLLVTIALAITFADSTVTEFSVAKGCLVLATADLVGLSAYWLSTSHFTSWTRTTFAALIGILVVPLGVESVRWVQVRQDKKFSVAQTAAVPTTPGNLLTPMDLTRPEVPPGCDIPDDALAIFLGSSVAWTTHMPSTIIKMGGLEVLSIDRPANSDSLVIKTLRIFDDRDDIIVRIDENGVWTAPQVRIKRPDSSTLTVYDHSDTEVLNVSFLNKSAVQITGVFRKSDQPPLAIYPDYFTMGSNKFRSACFGSAGNSVIVVGSP